MCMDPMTMLLVGSTALSAAGSVMEGNAAAEAGKLQQQSYNQQVQADAQASAFEAAQEKKKQDLARSAAVAQVGSSGVALTGSPSEVLIAQAGEDELDLQAISYSSKLRQTSLRTQGKISAFQGKQAQTAGYINAGVTLFKGGASIYDRSVQMGTNPFAKHPLYG